MYQSVDEEQARDGVQQAWIGVIIQENRESCRCRKLCKDIAPVCLDMCKIKQKLFTHANMTFVESGTDWHCSLASAIGLVFKTTAPKKTGLHSSFILITNTSVLKTFVCLFVFWLNWFIIVSIICLKVLKTNDVGYLITYRNLKTWKYNMPFKLIRIIVVDWPTAHPFHFERLHIPVRLLIYLDAAGVNGHILAEMHQMLFGADVSPVFQETPNGYLSSMTHYAPSCWSWRTSNFFSYFLILFHCGIITQRRRRRWKDYGPLTDNCLQQAGRQRKAAVYEPSAIK